MSTSFITTPPCTIPAMLASVISISWTSVTWLEATPSGFEIVHVRDSRRRGAGSMPACVASFPSSWSSPSPVRPVRVRTSPSPHPPGRPLRRPRRRRRRPRRPRPPPRPRARAPARRGPRRPAPRGHAGDRGRRRRPRADRVGRSRPARAPGSELREPLDHRGPVRADRPHLVGRQSPPTDGTGSSCGSAPRTRPGAPSTPSRIRRAGACSGSASTTGDLTGDAIPDVLSFEDVGGSGACGTYRVIATPRATRARSSAAKPATPRSRSRSGDLRIREAVFRADDPHCCPSAFRESALRWNGTSWDEISSEVVPNDPA